LRGRLEKQRFPNGKRCFFVFLRVLAFCARSLLLFGRGGCLLGEASLPTGM